MKKNPKRDKVIGRLNIERRYHRIEGEKNPKIPPGIFRKLNTNSTWRGSRVDEKRWSFESDRREVDELVRPLLKKL
ncbi:hypothetical protein KKC45_01595 [Patescibacteria group bacterium]|nr:hypothetical protein [Patescibacteria group bacterium]